MKLDKRIKRRLYREESTQKRARALKSERELLIKVVESFSKTFSSASSQSSLSPSSTSSSNFEDQLLSSKYQPVPDFVELKVPKKIVNSPEVVAALDHHKLSPYSFNDVLAAVVRASNGDLNNFVISTSTTNRTAKKCLYKNV